MLLLQDKSNYERGCKKVTIAFKIKKYSYPGYPDWEAGVQSSWAKQFVFFSGAGKNSQAPTLTLLKRETLQNQAKAHKII